MTDDSRIGSHSESSPVMTTSRDGGEDGA
jgi:hypothetical protein